MTASASERRLASHLLRRQSMTLPSTVEEQTTIYTHNTHTRKIYIETRSRIRHPPEELQRATGFTGKNTQQDKEILKSASSNASGIVFQGKNGAKAA